MEAPENMKIDLEAAQEIILRWESTASEEAREKMIFPGDRVEVDRYLLAIDQIQHSLSSASISDDQSKVNSAIQIAMARLEDEFRDILLTHTSTLESDLLTDPSCSKHSAASSTSGGAATGEFEDDNDEDKVEEEFLRRDDSSNSVNYRSTSSIREIDLIPSDAVINLGSVAERMISAGYLRECIQVYGSVRKSVVDSSFKRLGIEKLSIGDIQRLEWDQLEAKIRRWIGAAKICIRIVFASEKNLCEQIFYGTGTAIDDACFMETVKGPAIQLFSFAEAISISRRSPEKLFKILDLHNAFMDLIPDIDVVFASKSSESISIQGAEILSRLAEAERGILSEFENAVLLEPSRVLIIRFDKIITILIQI